MGRLTDEAIEILNGLHKERLDYDSEYVPLMDAANKLSAYEDTGLEPECIVNGWDYGCIFYCNRRCNLDGDWCAEGCGCPWEVRPNDFDTLKQIKAILTERNKHNPLFNKE